MTTIYFFAQSNPERPEGISGFSVTVQAEDGLPDRDGRMFFKACEQAKVTALSNAGQPVFVGYAGVPDLVVVLRNADIEAVFCRNSQVPPCVVIHDLDYATDEDEQLDTLGYRLQQEGYVRVAHLEDLPG